jgi:small-conductance mechanosensitive channel
MELGHTRVFDQRPGEINSRPKRAQSQCKERRGGAVAILIIGLWLSGKAHMLVMRMLRRAPHFDLMLVGFFGAIVRYLILTITVLAILSQFGIQTTSLVAVLRAAGLAVGLALQGTLSNLAAGVMLLIFRPFRVDQSVQVGSVQGTVKEVSLFWTELVTADNVQIIVPNSAVWGQLLRNYNFYPVRGIEVHFALPDPTKPETRSQRYGPWSSRMRGSSISRRRASRSTSPAAAWKLSSMHGPPAAT